MNLNLWLLFYEVARKKSVTKASKDLHISQPAITKQIKKLEEICDCKLFIRTKKGVILTKPAQQIYKDVEQALNIFSTVNKKIREGNDLLVGTIRIGISTTLAKNYLMPYIKKYHQEK